jgi:hypothetical protein
MVVAGCYEFTVEVGDCSLRMAYPAGSLLQLYRGERKRAVSWAKGTTLRPVHAPTGSALVETCPSLSYLPPEARQYIASISIKKQVSLKSQVLQEGLVSESLYVIVEGSFRKRGASSETILERGQEFGAECILGHGAYSITCLAHQSSILQAPILEIRRAMGLLTSE